MFRASNSSNASKHAKLHVIYEYSVMSGSNPYYCHILVPLQLITFEKNPCFSSFPRSLLSTLYALHVYTYGQYRMSSGSSSFYTPEKKQYIFKNSIATILIPLYLPVQLQRMYMQYSCLQDTFSCRLYISMADLADPADPAVPADPADPRLARCECYYGRLTACRLSTYNCVGSKRKRKKERVEKNIYTTPRKINYDGKGHRCKKLVTRKILLIRINEYM